MVASSLNDRSNNNNNKDDTADKTLEALQEVARKVGILTDQLSWTERELKRSRLDWMKEKFLLGEKVSVLTSILRQQQQQQVAQQQQQEEEQGEGGQQYDITADLQRELSIYQEQEEEILQEQERLEREVGILQDQMVRVHNLHRTEQRRTEELQYALEEVQNELEFEQTESMDEKKQLRLALEEQQTQIEKLQAQLEKATSNTATNGKSQRGMNTTMVETAKNRH